VDKAPSLIYHLRGLEVSLDGQPVLGPIDLQVERGAFLGVLGPNGSGKTTLLRALSGIVKRTAGESRLLGTPIEQYRASDLARMVGVVPQYFTLDFSFTVAEMVAMGRYAHSGRQARVPQQLLMAAGAPGSSDTEREPAAAPGRAAAGGRPVAAPESARTRRSTALSDDDAVTAALAETGLSALAERPVTKLSGGERQRALIAQTLAQESPVLLLDEPLNNLDLNHQLEVMQLLDRLHRAGRTIVVVLHDLNIAAQYCEQMVLLDGGRVAAKGNAAEILDPKVILEVFRVRVAVHRHGTRPYLTPLWSKADRTGQGETAKVHVLAGGGAASELLEELVMNGFTPSVGVVSVFDTDYQTAERYELEVVSAPPFQGFPREAVTQMERLARDSDVLLVAPVFFGTGNMELLRVALDAARAGRPVVFLDAQSVDRRDLTGGEAASLVQGAIEAGAAAVATTDEAIRLVREVAATRPAATRAR
jgi:iron complex transport system ATP-binding protein